MPKIGYLPNLRVYYVSYYLICIVYTSIYYLLTIIIDLNINVYSTGIAFTINNYQSNEYRYIYKLFHNFIYPQCDITPINFN